LTTLAPAISNYDWAKENLNGSRDLITPLWKWFVIHGLRLATIILSTKFQFSISTHYKDMNGNTKVKNGVVWSSYGSLQVNRKSAIRYSAYKFLL